MRMKSEVFAIELLKRPIIIERDAKGQVIVTVDRGGVEEMLISNEGKKSKVQACLTAANIDQVLKLDREVQAFLAGSDPGKIAIDLPKLDICLRWASGGALSIVTDSAGKKWVPFFFRDIPPYGWNISLGTAERWFNDDGQC